jgi:hypothetical protein
MVPHLDNIESETLVADLICRRAKRADPQPFAPLTQIDTFPFRKRSGPSSIGTRVSEQHPGQLRSSLGSASEQRQNYLQLASYSIRLPDSEHRHLRKAELGLHGYVTESTRRRS